MTQPLVKTVGDWEDLDEVGTHQARFVKADGRVIGIAMRHIVLGSDSKSKVWC